MLKNKTFVGSLLKMTCLFVCFGVMTLSLTACEPLRKKFSREKKKTVVKNTDFLPVLEPIDYPDKNHTSEEHYKQHYSLWKIWQEELIQSLSLEQNDKRQKYLLVEVIEQLKEMQKWIVEEKSAELAGIISAVQSVEKDFDEPSLMRNVYSMKQTIERAGKEIRAQFSPKIMTDYYISKQRHDSL